MLQSVQFATKRVVDAPVPCRAAPPPPNASRPLPLWPFLWVFIFQLRLALFRHGIPCRLVGDAIGDPGSRRVYRHSAGTHGTPREGRPHEASPRTGRPFWLLVVLPASMVVAAGTRRPTSAATAQVCFLFLFFPLD